MRQRLYLDVDGVLSPLPRPCGEGPWPPPTWPEWVDPYACLSTPFPTGLLDEIGLLSDEGVVEVVWATTWSAEMIHGALTDAGYPLLRFRHLAPSGRIDKTVAVRSDVLADPLPFVWIDDSRWPGDMSWKSPVPRLRLAPDRHVGLTPAMWAKAVRWLTAHL